MRKVFLFLLSFFVSFQACKSEPENTEKNDVLEEQIKTRFFNEIAPEISLPCFAGAYYRKAVSSVDNWIGIEGRVILPRIFYDSTRVNTSKAGQFLDNFSVYMGGTSDGQETDIGMTWEVIKDEAGNISKDRKAFRPFLRRTSHKSGQLSLYKNAPAESRYYWDPGDTIFISVQLAESGKLKFKVDGKGKSYEEVFDCAGYSYTNKAQFKRVNAIDQVSNEGKPVQATNAKAKGSKWLNVNLIRYYKSEALKAPMHSGRFTDMRCPAAAHFLISPGIENSGESIDISGQLK